MAYTKEAFAVLRKAYPRDADLPMVTVQKPKFQQNQMSYITETRLDLLKLLFGRQVEPSNLKAYRSVARAMRGDAQVSRHLDTLVGTAGFALRVDIDSVLRRFMSQMLEGQHTLRFSGLKFRRLYAGVEDYFYRNSVTLRYLAPLHGFQMDGNGLQLQPGLLLLRISTAEREAFVALAQRFGGTPGAPQVATGWEEFGIELTLNAPKHFGPQAPSEQALRTGVSANEELDRLVSALRLCKAGQISYGGTLATSQDWDPSGGVRTSVPSGRPVLLGPRYQLSSKDRKRFRNLWNDLRTLPVPKLARLNQAIRRFNFAYERVRPEDKLIDFAIALEALLLKREEDQELSYRLALRGAALLGRNAKNRERIRSLLKKAYDVRSDVVHGKIPPTTVNVDSSSLPFQEFVGQVEDVVRTAINRALGVAKGGKDLISGVEGKISQGSV